MTLQEIKDVNPTLTAWEDLVWRSVYRCGHTDPEATAKSAVRAVFMALNSRVILEGENETIALVKKLGRLPEDAE